MLVIGIIVGVAVLTLLVIFLVHQSARRQVRDLESRYNQIHDTFSTDCSNMIKRIESISKQNASYVQIFDSVQGRFSIILQENDKQCYVAVDSLKKLIGNKEYKDIKPIIDSTKASMDEFEKAASQLNNDLQILLKPEEEALSMSVALKEKFRALKEKHDANATALMSLDNSFKVLFDHITDMFASFEDYLNCADYNGAKKLLPEIEKLLDAADKVMGDLPFLNTLCDSVIPKRIAELTDAYHQLESENYPLHHLHLAASIEQMQKEVSECKKRLNNLSVKGVNEIFNKITAEINQYFVAFEKEKEAKKEFDAKQSSIDSSTYKCEKQYANLRNSLPSYCNVYKIDQTYLDQINVIKDMIDDMATKKRVLDSYINSSTKMPYSLLITTINELDQKVKLIQKAFDDFHEYLVGLKSDTDRSFAFVREAYAKLRYEDYLLRKVNIDALSDVVKPKIDQGYKMIEEIDTELKVTPINVMKLNEDYREAFGQINRVVQDLDEAIQNEARAENLFVYDNKFRPDCQPDTMAKLDKAESAFLEADFTRASMAAADIYKTESTRKAV
jgi:septation ring formation regulator EzrA